MRKLSRFRRQEFARRRRITVGDFATWIVSTKYLILSKLVWAQDSHSELQLRNVRNLITSECDCRLHRTLDGRAGVYDLWRECQP